MSANSRSMATAVADMALPMIMPRSRSPTVIFSPGISQMEAPFWAFAAGEAVTAVFSDKAPDSRASAVSSMVIRVAGCRVPVTISTMFSTTTMPGKKDMTNICSGVNACSRRQRRIM